MFSFFKRRKKRKFDNIDSLKIELKLIQYGLEDELKTKSAYDLHYELMQQWRDFKKKAGNNKSYYKVLISSLQRDCMLHDEFLVDYYSRWDDEVIYPAFKELALAYERNGEYKKAIYISKLAIEKDVNEHTSFENRIRRLERKLEKENTD